MCSRTLPRMSLQQDTPVGSQRPQHSMQAGKGHWKGGSGESQYMPGHRCPSHSQRWRIGCELQVITEMPVITKQHPDPDSKPDKVYVEGVPIHPQLNNNSRTRCVSWPC